MAVDPQDRLQVDEFDLVVDDKDDELIVGSFSITGKLNAVKQLYRRRGVIITISGPDGEVVAQSPGFVKAVNFPTFTSDMQQYTERAHVIALGEDV